MPFDGLVINSLVSELDNLILNERIDKIYQPEVDEIVLKIRNYKLLLSANSNFPHLSLINTQKVNPLSAPMFCMLLRKHLQGGKIVDIKQIDFERIVVFAIESYDELGNLVLKKLYCEIMGKHSNIILVDSQSNIIIDSIKRIPFSISRIRQILPGLEYGLPPTQGKLNLFCIDYEEFKRVVLSENKTAIYKALYKSFQGISPIIAQEICKRSNVLSDTQVNNISIDEISLLWNSISYIKELVANKNYIPNIIIDSHNKNIIEFSSINLNMYNDERYSIITKDSISEIVEKFYFEKDNYERIKQKSINIRKLVSTRLDRLYKKLQKQREELIIAKDADEYRIYGELILSNIYKISKGMNEIEVSNYYDDTLINIPLDVRLSPSENSQAYYKKYNKYKTALSKVSQQIEETEAEVLYLEGVLNSIENAENQSDIEEIKQELIEENYIKKKLTKSKKTIMKSQPLTYISTDGFLIEAGKNNKQNDTLTLKSSRGDLWFHTKDIPGSHVVIRTKGHSVPDNTIIEAAKIAAFNSKGKYSSNVPVDYTQIKYVKKPSGAKPGKVIYENYKTIYVTPIEKEINQLKNTK